MGTWTVPSTAERAAILETAMQRPIQAAIAKDVIGDAIGDDVLWDLLEEADEINPLADVRPLIARQLEEMTRWTLPSDFLKHWELGVRERLEFLASAYESAHLPLLHPLVVGDDPISPLAYVVSVDPPQDGERRLTGVRIAPGVHAVHDHETGMVYRVECRYGLVVAAPEEIRDQLRERFFPSVAPRFN